jgi:hypothetical protein
MVFTESSISSAIVKGPDDAPTPGFGLAPQPGFDYRDDFSDRVVKSAA